MQAAPFSAKTLSSYEEVEYKVLSCIIKSEEKELNKLGDEGWELVCSYCLGLYLILKREEI